MATLGEGLNLTTSGCLSSTCGNSAPKTKPLVNRLNRGLAPSPPHRIGPPTGAGIDEKAEAVRLARAGVSMRAIGRRMGVDRKAVRAALVRLD